MEENKIYEKGSFGWLKEQAKKDGFDNIRDWQKYRINQQEIDKYRKNTKNIDQVEKILEENNIAIKDIRIFYRFWSKVDIKDNKEECWNYVGCVDINGYGVFTYGMRTHCMAYTLMKGNIPDGLQVQHLCNNRRCCNLQHLELGNNSKNMLYAVKCGRLGSQKLVEDQVREIHKLYKEERCQHPNYLKWDIQKRLANKFGIDPSHINRIINGIYWHNIYDEFNQKSNENPIPK